MKTVQTYTATIYVGFHNKDAQVTHTIDIAERCCQEYCDEVGLCVSITPTSFIYSYGGEPGCAVGLIHYPRFPCTDPQGVIRRHALTLAARLRDLYGQWRVSVVFPDETVMLSDPKADGKAAC